MALRSVVQSHKRNRATSGISDFHEWRQALKLTQLDASRLLGVHPGTIQRWDAHPGAAPTTLEGCMAYHEIMRAEVKRISESWLDDNITREQFAKGYPDAATEANIELLGVTQMLAVEYGLKHKLF